MIRSPADVAEPERADPGGVDHPGPDPVPTPDPVGSRSAMAEVEVCRPRPVTSLTFADRPQRAGDQRIDQCRLADPGVPDEHAAVARQAVPQRIQIGVGRGHLDGTPSGSYWLTSSSGDARSALVRQSSGAMPGVEPGDQDPVDHPGPRRRVRQRGDDHQLVGVGHDRPLVRVVVVGRPPQHGVPLGDLDDPGQRALLAGGVADGPHPVADDDPRAAELAGLGGAHRPSVHQDR